MHKNNLALETDCTWGVPIVEVVKPEVETPKMRYHHGSCIKRDPVRTSVRDVTWVEHVLVTRG